MRTGFFKRIKEKLKTTSGFTLLEMIITAALISVFFAMTAAVIPLWHKSYTKAINTNYARQIAGSVMGTIEQQIRFANDVKIVDAAGTEADSGNRITGKCSVGKFAIPMEGTTNQIEGLVYDEKFFMNNDIELKFDMGPDKKYCTVTVTITRDGSEVLTKSRAVMLSGENGGA